MVRSNGRLVVEGRWVVVGVCKGVVHVLIQKVALPGLRWRAVRITGRKHSLRRNAPSSVTLRVVVHCRWREDGLRPGDARNLCRFRTRRHELLSKVVAICHVGVLHVAFACSSLQWLMTMQRCSSGRTDLRKRVNVDRGTVGADLPCRAGHGRGAGVKRGARHTAWKDSESGRAGRGRKSSSTRSRW